MDSDVRTQPIRRGCRAGDLRLAFVADKEIVKVHAQWWHSGMKGGIDAQARKDPGAQSVADGGGSVLFARVAEARNRVLGQELTEVDERLHADLVRKAKGKELDARGNFKVPCGDGRPGQGWALRPGMLRIQSGR